MIRFIVYQNASVVNSVTSSYVHNSSPGDKPHRRYRLPMLQDKSRRTSRVGRLTLEMVVRCEKVMEKRGCRVESGSRIASSASFPYRDTKPSFHNNINDHINPGTQESAVGNSSIVSSGGDLGQPFLHHGKKVTRKCPVPSSPDYLFRKCPSIRFPLNTTTPLSGFITNVEKDSSCSSPTLAELGKIHRPRSSSRLRGRNSFGLDIRQCHYTPTVMAFDMQFHWNARKNTAKRQS